MSASITRVNARNRRATPAKHETPGYKQVPSHGPDGTIAAWVWTEREKTRKGVVLRKDRTGEEDGRES